MAKNVLKNLNKNIKKNINKAEFNQNSPFIVT